MNGPLKGNLGLESRSMAFITLTKIERKTVDAMNRAHEIPVRNQESGIQGSQDVVSAGSSHPRSAGMKPMCWRSIVRPIGVMMAVKDCRDSRSVNLMLLLSAPIRMNVGNWNIQHRDMKRVRRMSVVVTA